ncbi:MAG: response regulator transcription factor [Bacteroidales bacterium]|jgi:two-component system alkaline phosphatase synthesis response regulator PhoP|nr:response regulator transcription factor [Bacteroidales bacterium]HPH53835.1 response regulator transcription factor [Bacteroidales bacterium]
MARILVIEDEVDLCEILQFNLEQDGHQVDITNSAESAMKMDIASYDLLLLDVMLGGISGFRLASLLRENPVTANIPIIFTTALGESSDVVKGLEAGGDDYICKPVRIAELKARIRAVLRRCAPQQGRELSGETDVVYSGIVLTIDAEQKAAFADGHDLKLTKLEFEVLRLLVSNSPKVFSREQIISAVWPSDVIVTDRTVDVNITRLRRKLGPLGSCVKTRIGYGYSFETE